MITQQKKFTMLKKRGLKFCYHAHTRYCKHSTATMEELIQAAIKNGFQELGISEHVCYPDDRQGADYRLNYNLLEEYLNLGQKMKQKYAGQIKIWIGFECEFFVGEEAWYYQLSQRQDVDYLIFGNHGYPDNKSENYFGAITTVAQLKLYGDSAKRAMASGLFKYFAHPDLYMRLYLQWDEHCEKLARQIIEAAVQYHIPLGVNFVGLMITQESKLQRPMYPHPEFWKIASEYNVQVILEPDAHSVQDLDQKRLALLIQFAERYVTGKTIMIEQLPIPEKTVKFF